MFFISSDLQLIDGLLSDDAEIDKCLYSDKNMINEHRQTNENKNVNNTYSVVFSIKLSKLKCMVVWIQISIANHWIVYQQNRNQNSIHCAKNYFES